MYVGNEHDDGILKKKWNDFILTEQKIAWRNARVTMSMDF